MAKKGSWFGGGSVAALAAALAAALLEKLVTRSAQVRPLRRIRRACVTLVEQDARAFARVVSATRSKQPGVFHKSLKRAIDIPCQVFAHAQAIQAACRRAQRVVKPRFQSDLRCAMALALAAAESARTLIQTNLTWLNDPGYARAVRRRLHAAR